jgi:tRNA(His) 5'-end guanylyltransferase
MEDASSLYHCGVVVCQTTHSMIKDYFHVREVDCVRIGKNSNPFLMYEVLAPTGTELSQDARTSILCYELGLIEYRTQNWQAAVIHFKKSVQLTEDAPAKVLINRLKYIADHPQCIPPEWDGIWDIVDEI